jgi:thioredoxin 1
MKVAAYFLFLSIFFLPFGSCQSQSAPKKNTGVSPEKSDIEHLTAATFKQKVFDYSKNKEWKFAGDKPCIIDFYATWCGPCKAMAPTVDQIAKQYKGKINVYKVDVDAQQELASVFGVSSIPSVLFCPSSAKPQMSEGLISKIDFDQRIKDILKVNL